MVRRTKPSAEPAVRAVKAGETRIVPAQWEDLFRLDGTSATGASRQIWWVWIRLALPDCGQTTVDVEAPAAAYLLRVPEPAAGRRRPDTVLLGPVAVFDDGMARIDLTWAGTIRRPRL